MAISADAGARPVLSKQDVATSAQLNGLSARIFGSYGGRGISCWPLSFRLPAYLSGDDRAAG